MRASSSAVRSGASAAPANSPSPALAPADRRAEGDAVVAQLALVAERLELGEEVVALDRVHARVVELVEVHVVGPEPAQAGLERGASVLRRPVRGPLALGVLLAFGVEHVAELRRDLDRVAISAAKRPSHDLLVGPLAVRVAGVEERDTELECAPDQPLGVVGLAPPVGPERPGAEGDLG